MKAINETNELRPVLWRIERLQKLSKQIHHLDECACNYGLTQRQETRLKNLLTEANTQSDNLGLATYHQGDPRGCSLYLIEKGTDVDRYDTGIAL